MSPGWMLSQQATSFSCFFSPFFPGNEHNHFRINPSTGLVMRGVRHLDREQNSSHVLEVEAYNTEQGPMRSSVRVREDPAATTGCIFTQNIQGAWSFPVLAAVQGIRKIWHEGAGGNSLGAAHG